MFAGALRRPDSVIVASGGDAASSTLRHGFHSHDAWEVFAPLRGSLRFEIAGQPPFRVSSGKLVLVPPGCLHLAVDRLAQPPNLELVVMNLPGEQANYGALRIGAVHGGRKSTLAADELALWTELLGEAPATVMDRVVRALAQSAWGRERALGGLRAMLAAYAEIIAAPPSGNRCSIGKRRVTEALSYLQSHYYQPDLTIAGVAAVVGMSSSHLSNLFRQVTGRSVRQTLIDIRLRRALALLQGEAHSIKEIAALTGWNNQLYFSTAFRRRYRRPPSNCRSGEISG